MIEYLKWDSLFFGKRIGKINLKSFSVLDQTDLDCNDFDLIYIFSDKSIKTKATLVDVKMTFIKSIINKGDKLKVQYYNSQENDYDQLLELVYLSGHESRFQKEPFFSNEDYKKLYKRWIDNSIENKSTKVIVSKEYNLITGFITVRLCENISKIDLIAVSKGYQGKGIGKQLLLSAESEIKTGNQLTVSTQESNIAACKFYLNSNYNLIDKTYIYHYVPNSL